MRLDGFFKRLDAAFEFRDFLFNCSRFLPSGLGEAFLLFLLLFELLTKAIDSFLELAEVGGHFLLRGGGFFPAAIGAFFIYSETSVYLGSDSFTRTTAYPELLISGVVLVILANVRARDPGGGAEVP